MSTTLPASILFVCTANRMRSAFAAGAVEQLELRPAWLADVPIASAGVAAIEGERAVRDAVDVGRTLRVDLSRHRSRPLSAELARDAWVIGFTPEHLPDYARRVAWRADLLGSFVDQSRIEDPWGMPAQLINSVFQQILYGLAAWRRLRHDTLPPRGGA